MNDESNVGQADELADVLTAIKEQGGKSISTPELDPQILANLSDSEAELVKILCGAALPVADFYSDYINKYPGDWFKFGAQSGDKALPVSAVFESASEFAYQHEDIAYLGDYLSYISYDWRHLIHRFHPSSLSEREFFVNERINNGKIVVRSSPGLETYMQPNGFDPCFNIRIGVSVGTSPRMQLLQAATFNYQGANTFQDNIKVIVRDDNLGIGSGLHQSEPSGSQYVTEIDGVVYVVINSNINVQNERNRELEESCRRRMAPGVFERNRKAILSSDIEVIGHENTEVILENLYKNPIKKLGGRHAVELASTLSFLDALRISRNLYGREYGQLYEDGSWRIISRMMLRRDPKDDEKMAVYSRGFDLALTELERAGAFYYYDDRISDINWPIFDDVLHRLSVKLLTIIRNGDRQANDQLFELTRRA